MIPTVDLFIKFFQRAGVIDHMIRARALFRGRHLRIQAGCRKAISAPPTFMLNGRKIQCESQDEDLIIDAMIEKGGAQA